MSGSMTGSHVDATHDNCLLTKEATGQDIGAPFLMCRTHECRGCMDAQERPWLLLVGWATRSNSPVKGEINNQKNNEG